MARAALREFTLTLREGDQISLWLRGAPRTRRACLYLSGSIVSWFRVADAFLTNRSRSPCARARRRATPSRRIVAYNLAAPGARPGAYGSQMRGAWRTQGKRGTTRMLPPPPPSPPPSPQESSCRHSNSRTCTMQSQSRAASNIPTSPYRCRAPPPCLPPSPPRPRRPRRCRPRRCPRRRRRRV